MTALILKDIATLKKTLLLTIALCIALIVYGVYENEIFMIPLICTMIPLILTAIAFGYDTKSKFEQFAFSMPVKKSSFVLSKLFFAFVFGLIGSVCLRFFLITLWRYFTTFATIKYRQHHIYLTNYISCKYFDISYSTSVYPKVRCRKR